jgi:hypothetical protein
VSPEDVDARVAKIAAMKGDSEAAHCEEDGLYRDVLRAIANGEVRRPAGLAAAALKASELKYDRWYA